MNLPGLEAALAQLVHSGLVIDYGTLARQLAIPGPGSIARLAAALEDLMAQDAAAGLPFRAALVCARLGNGEPAPGFFKAAARLGRYDGTDPASFVAAERARLFKAG